MQTLRSLHMNDLRDQLPDEATLTAGLKSVFSESAGARLEVISRLKNDYTSTFPTEIVKCRLSEVDEITLLCKYEAGHGRSVFSGSHTAYGHRSGPAYEADVYRRVLGPLGLSSPRFFGAHTDDRGDLWLVIEYLEKAKGIDEASSPGKALRLASRWIAEFHARNEKRLNTALNVPELSFLKQYDATYYRQWAARTLQFAGRWSEELPWLDALARRYAESADNFLALPLTIVHGEFTPHNVLIRETEIYPVDWESTAIAFGELDLIALIDKWPASIARACEREYLTARWPGPAPADYDRRLDLARMYWDFRWLGDRPEWTGSRKVGARFEHLRATAERLGWL